MLTLALLLQGGLPRPCPAGAAAERQGPRLSSELCAPSSPLGPAGNAGDLLLQALEQSCLEDHLLEAAWGLDPIPPEAPGETLGWVGVLCLAGPRACQGEEQGGPQSHCRERGRGGG